MKLAKGRGAEVIPGIEMFVHQAARQFEIWTGKPAPWDDMLRVVTLALQERTAARQAPKPMTRSLACPRGAGVSPARPAKPGRVLAETKHKQAARRPPR